MTLRVTYLWLSYGLSAAVVIWTVAERRLTGGIAIALALAVAYAAAYVVSGSAGFLYPALLFASSSYALMLRFMVHPPWYPLALLPLLTCWEILGLRWTTRERKRVCFTASLSAAGAVTLLTLLLAPDTSSRAGMGFAAIAALYLLVWRLHGNRWHLLAALLAMSGGWRYLAPLAFESVPVTLLTSLAALPTVAVAVVLHRRGRQHEALPIFTAAAVLVVACGIFAYLADAPEAVLPVLLIGAVVNATVFWKIRSDESLYLVVLALGIMAYHFIRMTEDRFFGMFVNYFLYGLLLVSALFCYPLLKRAFQWSWSLSQALSLYWPRVALAFLPLMVGFVGISLSYVNQVTENPSFCGSCHTMKAVYASWKTSKHNDVGCVDCHYPPDLTSFAKGRIAGVMMAAKHFTGFYPPKAHGNVDSRSCQTAACHTSQKLYRPTTYRENTLNFNHETMLVQPVRGMRLQCNTCHSHDVEGEHFTTDFSTCYLCHFMNRDPRKRTAIGTCASCHRGLSTRQLTQRLTVRGDGRITRARCLSCHETLTGLGDVQRMHDKHVSHQTDFTKSKVGCLACHDEIEHGDFGVRVPQIAPLAHGEAEASLNPPPVLVGGSDGQRQTVSGAVR